ncbi:hypothetical protein ACFXGE_32065, partial [Streptomyces sp. NPDC059378]
GWAPPPAPGARAWSCRARRRRGAAPSPPQGAGIRGMRERALLIGATLDITSGPTAGTQVRLTVPTSPRKS